MPGDGPAGSRLIPTPPPPRPRAFTGRGRWRVARILAAMDVVPFFAFERIGALWLPRPAALPTQPAPEPDSIRMIDGRPMQCKDIPDDAFLDAVRRIPAVDGSMKPSGWRTRWAVQAELETALGPIPEKLFLAKARRLGRRRLLGGCTECTCRGDYHIAADCPYPSCCPPVDA